MTIVIRTNCNGTLGHLARCRHISKQLQTHGYQTVFLLDKTPDFALNWLDDIAWEAVYPDQDEQFIDQHQDSRLCVALAGKHQPILIIVDDYRLDHHWEAEVAHHCPWVMALDDLGRDHCVDILLEPRYTIAQDKREHTDHCLIMKGPDFTLLDPAYSQPRVQKSNDTFTVMFGLGGGGNMHVIHDCMLQLLEAPLAPCSDDDQQLRLMPVIGPMATNTSLIHALAKQYPHQISVIEPREQLADVYRSADLFVGAAGTSVYEAAACEVPALTLSLSDNQQSQLADLEPLGHYFHTNDFNHENTAALAGTILAFREQYARVKLLTDHAALKIDGRGVQRVCEKIVSLIKRGEAERRVVCPAPGNSKSAGSQTAAAPATTTDFTVAPCTDADINSYLDARTLPANRGNMTTTAKIDRLHHYRWWFQTKRQSFRVEQQQCTRLYIWHEVVCPQDKQVLIGGWFVTDEHIDFACVMSALSWQLAHTDRHHPGVPWVAVIRKSNRFVLKMNLRAGFTLVEPCSDLHKIVQTGFPDASAHDFHFLYRGVEGGQSATL
ncbi:MAG: hypothetical protein AAF404_16535 [Pseudomonadota bacterium]